MIESETKKIPETTADHGLKEPCNFPFVPSCKSELLDDEEPTGFETGPCRLKLFGELARFLDAALTSSEYICFLLFSTKEIPQKGTVKRR